MKKVILVTKFQNYITFFYFLVRKFDKKKINEKLYKRLFEIESKGYKTIFGKLYPIYHNKINTKNIAVIKNNIVEIAQENLFMYKRIKDKHSSYELNKLLKDYSKNQYYKQNACRYPSIDFIKDIKNKSINSKEHKRKKNIMTCKTENNYFPKIYNTITSNFKSNVNFYKNEMNTYEGFENIKNKKIKRKKKKFKDFNFKDLKKLKEKIFNNIKKSKKDDINTDKNDAQIGNEKKISNNNYNGIEEKKNNNNIENNDINKETIEKIIENEKKLNYIDDNKVEYISLENNINLEKEEKYIPNEMEENKNINNNENNEINKNIIDKNIENEKKSKDKNDNKVENFSLENNINYEKEEKYFPNENNKDKDE